MDQVKSNPMAELDDKEKKQIKAGFDEVVNMSSSQLKKWLTTDQSKSVGQHQDGESESIGHKSGERIIDLLDKKATEFTVDDYSHMQKVISYVKRHSAQQPKEVKNSNWEYSLKNWGHDPEKK